MREAWVLGLSLANLICGISHAEATRAPHHDAREVRKIEIDPLWSGDGERHKGSIVIRWDGLKFRRDGPYGSASEATSEIKPAVIQSLLSALREPTLSVPTLGNLKINHEWLESHVDEQLQNTGSMGETNGVRQREFFRQSFTDPTLIDKLLPGVVAERWTDDGAWVHVSVDFADGTTWTGETDALSPFMLPWKAAINGHTNKTYNADVSRAVAALLPEGTLNRNRLLGVGIERLIGSAVEIRIKARWQEMGAEEQAGTALAELKKRYLVRRSEVSSHQGLGFGDILTGNSLQADVRLASFPENLVVATSFPIRNGTVSDLHSFFSNGGRYQQLVLGNPWIMKSLRGHPDVGAWLYFMSGTSLSEKAERIFDADMREIGRPELITQVDGHREDVALLNYNGNQIILFPDHHAIIWRWGPYRELFSWTATSLKTQRCTDYNTSTEGCAGAIVSSDGKLQN